MFERGVVPVDSNRVARATSLSIKRIKDTIESAFKLVHDSQHVQRHKEQKCIPCFYIDRRIAQQAFFSQPCGLCLVPQTYANSNTNILCLKCAQKHHLCRQCGSDISLKPDRIFKGNQDATGSESTL